MHYVFIIMYCYSQSQIDKYLTQFFSYKVFIIKFQKTFTQQNQFGDCCRLYRSRKKAQKTYGMKLLI